MGAAFCVPAFWDSAFCMPAVRSPHSSLHTPQSALLTPHSALRTPLFYHSRYLSGSDAKNAITEKCSITKWIDKSVHTGSLSLLSVLRYLLSETALYVWLEEKPRLLHNKMIKSPRLVCHQVNTVIHTLKTKLDQKCSISLGTYF